MIVKKKKKLENNALCFCLRKCGNLNELKFTPICNYVVVLLFFRLFLSSFEPLKAYQGEDIEIQLPRSLTMNSIDWLAVWCVQHTHNFGHVNVPDDLDVPPALGQTKLTVSTNRGNRGNGGGGGGNRGSVPGQTFDPNPYPWIVDYDALW